MFTSRRERRIWIWILVILVGIFSTLAYAPVFAHYLRETGLSVILFVTGMFLVALTAITHGFSKIPGVGEITVIFGVITVYFMVFTRMGTLEERSHLIEYGVVAVLILEALFERRKVKELKFPAIWAIAITSVIGLLDESVQYFIPSRVFSWEDVFFNFLAACMGIGTSWLLTLVANKVYQKKQTKESND